MERRKSSTIISVSTRLHSSRRSDLHFELLCFLWLRKAQSEVRGVEDSELFAIRTQHLDGAAVEELILAVADRDVSANLEFAGSHGCAKPCGGFATQVDDVIEAGDIIV